MIVTTHSIFFRRWAIGKQTLRYRYLSCKKHPTIRYATLIIVLHLIFHFVLGILFGSICFYIVCRAPSLTYGIFLGINILLFFIDIKFSLPCNFLAHFFNDWNSCFTSNKPFYKRFFKTQLSYQLSESPCSCFISPRTRSNYIISFRSYFWMLFSTCWETKAMRLNIIASTVTCILLRIFYYSSSSSDTKTIDTLMKDVFFSFTNPFWSFKTLIHPLLLFILFQCVIQAFCFLQWMLRLAIEQPSFIQENRLPMRTSYIACYASEQEACLLNRQASSNLFNLSSANQSFTLSFFKYNSFSLFTRSSWYVACFPNLVSIPPYCHTNDYAKNIFKASELKITEPSWNVWYSIPFPLNSEAIPFPINKSQNTNISYLYEKINPPMYTNIPYPFTCNPPFVSNTLLSKFNHQRGSPFTCYLCSFETPWTLTDKTNLPVVSLIIQGCGPAFYVFLNGYYIGYSTDTFLSSEFLVSSQLHWTYEESHTTLSPKKLTLQGTTETFLESTTKVPLESTTKLPFESTINSPFEITNKSFLESNTKTFLESTIKTPLESPSKVSLESPSKVPLESPSKVPLESPSKVPLDYGNRNTLLLVVPRWCATSYLEDQDHWWFSGCFRDVELMRWPLQENNTFCNTKESQHNNVGDRSETLCSVTNSLGNTTKLCIEDFSVSTRLTKTETTSNFSKGFIHISILLGKELMKKDVCYHLEKTCDGMRNENVFHNAQLSNFGLQARLFFCGCPARKESGTGDLKPLHKEDISPLDFSSYSVEDLNMEWDFLKNSKQIAFIPATPFSINSIMVNSLTNFSTHLEFTVENPMLWCDESPYLYMVCISLVELNSSKKALPSFLQCEATLIGFTNVSFHSSQLCINDRPCLLKGVNRHEHHPFNGKHTPYATILDDLLLIKQYNFNAIRTSHYPNTPFFYFLCTLLGIYVVDEANIETHGDVLFAWNRFLSFLTIRLPLYPLCRLANDPDWKLPWLTRISRMVLRDACNPCIILWSIGNEAGCGTWPREAKKFLMKPSNTFQYRPVQYEPGHSPLDSSDIFCPMYMPFKQVQNYAMKSATSKQKKNLFKSFSRPLILCEYQHAMGNSNGDMDKYWEAFYTYSSLQGGFIWDFADQGLLQSKILDNQDKIYHWAYGGDFANDITDKNFNHNGLLYPDRRLKPGIIEAKYVQQPILITFHSVTCSDVISHNFKQNIRERSSLKNINITLKVLNKQIYNDLKHFQCHYTLTSLYHSSLQRTGTLTFPETCGPSSSTFILIKISNLPIIFLTKQLNLVLHIILNKTFLWAKKGHTVARCQILIDIPTYLPQVHLSLCSPKLPHLLYFPLPSKHPLLWHSCHLKGNLKKIIQHDNFWFVRRLFIENLKNSCCSHQKSLQEWSLQSLKTKLESAQPLTSASTFSITSFFFTSLATPFNVYEIFNYNNVSIFIHCETGVIEGLSIQHPYPSLISSCSLTKSSCSFHSFLYGPIHYNFVRAPTDNDRGGLDVCQSPLTMLCTTGILGALWGGTYWFTNPNQNVKSYYSSWKKAGLHEMESSLVDFKVFFDDSNLLHKTSLQLQLIQNHAPKSTLSASPSYKIVSFFFPSKMSHYMTKSSYFQTKSTYTLYYNGLCQFDSIITPLPALLSLHLPSIPRIGLSLCLPSLYHDIVYCGLGPHENYCDRNASAIMGVFKTSIDALYEPYTVPSENGNRGNVQWISLMQPSNQIDKYLYGLLVLKNEKNDPGLECSVQPFSIEQLTNANHPSDLGVSVAPRSPYSFDEHKNHFIGSNQDLTHETCKTLFYCKEKYRKPHLHIDAKQMGVGGECSWLPCLYNHSTITYEKQKHVNYSQLQIPTILLVPIYRCQNKRKYNSSTINKRKL